MKGRRLPALDEVLLAAEVDRCLSAFMCRRSAEHLRDAPASRQLFDLARATTLSGKHLRPSFCYWAYRAVGAVDDRQENILAAASSLELLHSAALVHDDIIDGSDERRGRPSAHRAFEALLPGGSTHVAQRFGLAAALVLGDLLLVWADELFQGSGLPEAALARARPWYDVMRSEVVTGEFLDILGQACRLTDSPMAATILQLKSARYTAQRPVQIGATLAGGRPEQIHQLAAFGSAVGEAFQLRDDLLDVFGDPLVVGKPVGQDLRDHCCTLLLSLALDLATRHQRSCLHEILARDRITDAEIAVVQEILESSGARQRCEDRIDARLSAALRAMRSCPGLTDDGSNALETLALASAYRSG